MVATGQKELPFQPRMDPLRMKQSAGEAAILLRTIANENRLIILCQLSRSECSVGELNSLLPLSQSALSQHLARLRRDGLVSCRRKGTQVFYALMPGPAATLLETLYETYCESGT